MAGHNANSTAWHHSPLYIKASRQSGCVWQQTCTRNHHVRLSNVTSKFITLHKQENLFISIVTSMSIYLHKTSVVHSSALSFASASLLNTKLSRFNPYTRSSLRPCLLACNRGISCCGCGSWKTIPRMLSSFVGLNCHFDPPSFSISKFISAIAKRKSVHDISPGWFGYEGLWKRAEKVFKVRLLTAKVGCSLSGCSGSGSCPGGSGLGAEMVLPRVFVFGVA